MSSEIKDGVAKAPAPPVAEPVLPPPPPTPWWPMVLTGLLAVVPAAILGFLYWQSLLAQDGLRRELTDARAETEAAVSRARAATAQAAAVPGVAAAVSSVGAPASEAPADAPLAVEYVPYGEAPLANARLERLRQLVASLEAQRFRGRVLVETFVGDFCLSGNASDGFAVAKADLPTQQCDLVGNPFDDALAPAQRQSLAFANFAATLSQRTAGGITVETVSLGRRNPVQYPEQREGSTAGDWNAVAAQNNRVEFHLSPAE